MSKLERITVTVTEEMAAKLRAAVDSGEYATTSEIVRDALRDWSDYEERRRAKLERMRAMIGEAEASETMDGPTVMAEIREYVTQLVAEEIAGEQADKAA